MKLKKKKSEMVLSGEGIEQGGVRECWCCREVSF